MGIAVENRQCTGAREGDDQRDRYAQGPVVRKVNVRKNSRVDG